MSVRDPNDLTEGPVIKRRVDFLQERLTRETTRPEFSDLPFRFAEVAKIILDMFVCRSFQSCVEYIT